MVGIAYVVKRLWNPEVFIDANNVIPHKCKKAFHEGYPMMYEIKWRGGTQAGEELGTVATAKKDGTTTPFQLTVVSTSALDDRDNAAGTVQSVAVIGISVSSIYGYTNQGEVPQTTVEVIEMNGTVDVVSTRFYLWVDHVYAVEWGSGATFDAEGIITVESPANTNLLVLPATFNEGEGGTWHFPKGARVSTHKVDMAPTAALAGGDGVALTGVFTKFDHIYQTENLIERTDTFTYIHYGGEPPHVHDSNGYRFTGTHSASCVWTETLIANTQTIEIKIMQQVDRHNY